MSHKKLQDTLDDLFLALMELDDVVSDIHQNLKGAYERIQREHAPDPDSDITIDEWEQILLEGEMELLEYRRLRHLIEMNIIKLIEL